MAKPVILTGLRANNDLHIGNYFGALLPMVDMARQHSDKYEIQLFVPDLHSFTTPIDHSQLQSQIMHNLKLFAAAGLPLDDDNIRVYRQSYVPAHSELTWILDCFTGFGQLRRMTQLKDKAGTKGLLEDAVRETEAYGKAAEEIKLVPDKDWQGLSNVQTKMGSHISNAVSLISEIEEKEGHVSVGLFNYPALMAADILLYGAKYVPVGDDQSQHLEFTRDIAERMNSRFGELFTLPEPVKRQHEFFGKDQGLRIKDLVDPTKKMSKSADSDKGVIFLGDSPAAAAKKVKSAATDSFSDGIKYDPVERPGISNLLQIHALLSDETLDAVAAHHEGQTSYGDLKTEVAEQVEEFLSDFQKRLANVSETKLLAKLEADEKIMNERANETLYRVQKAVGLR